MYNNYNRFGYAQYPQQPAYQQQQPMYQQPMNTQDMPIQAIRFMNETEAKAYIVPLMQKELLVDREKGVAYLKSADSMGQSSRDYYGDITRRDYGEEEYKLSPTEIRKWERELKQSGAKFTADQVRQVAQQHGIRFDEFSPELLTAVANMMYTDYDETVRGDIAMYVKLAKDFLCDEDFDGTPEEKAYLYYNVIVNKDDD